MFSLLIHWLSVQTLIQTKRLYSAFGENEPTATVNLHPWLSNHGTTFTASFHSQDHVAPLTDWRRAETILRQTNTNERFVAPECAFSALGVSRSGRWKVGWGGEKVFRGWRGDIVWRGSGWSGGRLRLATRLQLFCRNGQKQPWHYDIVSSQKYTHTPRIMARWPRHLLRCDVQERENRITDLVTTYRGSVSAVFLMVVVC